jgi:hypothetical protein
MCALRVNEDLQIRFMGISRHPAHHICPSQVAEAGGACADIRRKRAATLGQHSRTMPRLQTNGFAYALQTSVAAKIQAMINREDAAATTS